METPGGRRPTPSLDPSENTFSAQKYFVLRICAWFKEGPDGEALLFGEGGQNKGVCPSLISTAGYLILYTLPHLEIHPIQPHIVALTLIVAILPSN